MLDAPWPALVDALPTSIYAVDRQLRVVVWNRARERGPQGIPRNQALGLALDRVLPPSGYRRAAAVIRAVFDGGVEYETAAATAGGRLFRARRLPVREGDRITHVMSCFDDVTELERARPGGASPDDGRSLAPDLLEFLGLRRVTDLQRAPLPVVQGALMAWKGHLERKEPAATARVKLAALTSLLAAGGRGAARGQAERLWEGLEHSDARLKGLLEAPPRPTLRGLRDSALLGLAFEAGLWCSTISRLSVADLDAEAGVLRVGCRRGHVRDVALGPRTRQRLVDYLARAGHAGDHDGPLVRPILPSGESLRAPISETSVSAVLCQGLSGLGVPARHACQTIRASFIAWSLERGASLEAACREAGYASPGR